MKILLVDDEPLARQRLAALVRELGGHDIVAEAGNGREAVELAGEHAADVVLLDVAMPVMDGLEAARHLATLPSPPTSSPSCAAAPTARCTPCCATAAGRWK